MKNSICIFSHYHAKNTIPYYVQVYISELKKYFDQLVFVTNQRPISNIETLGDIKFIQTPNQGYDLGMYLTALKEIDLENVEILALINDSNIVFGSLEKVFVWSKNQNLDFWGLYDSYNRPSYSTNPDNYHIQSHFLVFNKTAMPALLSYINTLLIKELYAEKNVKEVKKWVINYWEIGATQYLLNQGLTCDSYLRTESLTNNNQINISLKKYKEIVKNGLPIIKKRVAINYNFFNYGLFFRYSKGISGLNINQLVLELMQLKFQKYWSKLF